MRLGKTMKLNGVMGFERTDGTEMSEGIKRIGGIEGSDGGEE
jgi:hypothetical protein